MSTDDIHKGEQWTPNYGLTNDDEVVDSEHVSGDSLPMEHLLYIRTMSDSNQNKEHVDAEQSDKNIESTKQCVCDVYDEIQKLITHTDIEEKLKEELSIEFGDLSVVIGRLKEELMESDCPIVVTGETSAGKSSFINLLIGCKLLPYSVLSCTSTICRLRNRHEKALHLVDEHDTVTKLPLPSNIDAETMNEKLQEYVNPDDNQNCYKYVDIDWPIPILQDGAVIVDTPGIGTNSKLTSCLLDYLPKAISLIYVIKSSNAGGVQNDRLLKIFEEQTESKCVYKLDPNRAIFVCNMWDQISKKEENKVSTYIVQELKKSWPNFKETQMFKLSAKKESKKVFVNGPETGSDSFKGILRRIKEMIPVCLQAKISSHLRWQHDFMEQMLRRIVGRIKLSMKTEEEKIKIQRDVDERLKKLKHDIKEVQCKVTEEAENKCKQISEKLHDHIKSKETVSRIFMWSIHELPEYSQFDEIEYKARQMIIGRINDEIREWCQRDEISNFTKDLSDMFYTECKLIEEERQKINEVLFGEELSLGKGLQTQHETNKDDTHAPLFTKQEKIVLAVSSPLWLPLIVGAGIIALPFGAAAGLKAIVQEKIKIKDYKTNKLKFMMDWSNEVLNEYNKFAIYKIISETYLKDFHKSVKRVCETAIPQQIEADEKYISNIKNDIRSSSLIRKQYKPLEYLCKAILGKLMFMDIEFCGNQIADGNIKELKEMTEIGHGQFSDVYQVEIKIGDKWEKAAVKTIRKPFHITQSYVQLIEVENLRKLTHPNIVRLYGVGIKHSTQNKRFLQIFMEYCEDTLEDVVMKKREPPPCFRFRNISECTASWEFYVMIMCDVCQGLEHIHSREMVHRDLKLANILIKNGKAKIADVGMATEEISIQGTFTGTPTTMAPEIFQGKLYGTSVDIYSVGIMLWEMWYGRPGYTFPSSENTEEYRFIAQNMTELSVFIINGTRPDFDNKFQPHHNLQFLMKKCWSGNPTDRPTAECVLNKLREMQ
ncbi:uncharacterized protein LOC127728682 [Mytilus californianus]|uniref:uncharacterized protein LOC127728682 n=1 Tax=Mytilus californianus TaxID=6549 RepID=UPI0022474177|nr:uncharacterized protein LOC127728682 [Mytilus californianus]